MIIYKYELPAEGVTIRLPEGAEFLSVQAQGSAAQMWFLLDEGNPFETPRKFFAFPDDQPIALDPKKYLGTFQLEDGQLVFHAFELLT